MLEASQELRRKQVEEIVEGSHTWWDREAVLNYQHPVEGVAPERIDILEALEKTKP